MVSSNPLWFFHHTRSILGHISKVNHFSHFSRLFPLPPGRALHCTQHWLSHVQYTGGSPLDILSFASFPFDVTHCWFKNDKACRWHLDPETCCKIRIMAESAFSPQNTCFLLKANGFFPFYSTNVKWVIINWESRAVCIQMTYRSVTYSSDTQPV